MIKYPGGVSEKKAYSEFKRGMIIVQLFDDALVSLTFVYHVSSSLRMWCNNVLYAIYNCFPKLKLFFIQALCDNLTTFQSVQNTIASLACEQVKIQNLLKKTYRKVGLFRKLSVSTIHFCPRNWLSPFVPQ